MNNKFTEEDLEKILNLHKKWINGDENGVRANLSEANLSKADLRGADLIGADLRGANLSEANLSEACLRGANLSEANLRGASLIGADLRESSIIRANLSESDLGEADLSGAYLRGADLSGAYLIGADLRVADLIGADLSGAKINYPLCCPEEGSFIGFKKASGYIVKLEILSDALRSSATTRKCRCDKARVLSITIINGEDDGTTSVSSNRDKNFIYKVGEIVEVKDFDTNRWNECSTGIHFFITRQEAVDYI